jgi:hypothetical protein
VRLRRRPCSKEYNFAHWSYVGPGAPWQHTSYWEPPTEFTPTEPDRIAALEQRVVEPEGVAELPGGLPDLEQRVAELEATMRQLLHGSRFRLVVEPR